MWLSLLHQDVHSPCSSATVFVSATALQAPLRTPKVEFAEAALQIASAASPIHSVMHAMLALTLAKVYALLPPLPALQASSDTTASVTLDALQELVNKATSVKGFALPARGPSTVDATGPAQPN